MTQVNSEGGGDWKCRQESQVGDDFNVPVKDWWNYEYKWMTVGRKINDIKEWE